MLSAVVAAACSPSAAGVWPSAGAPPSPPVGAWPSAVVPAASKEKTKGRKLIQSSSVERLREESFGF